MKEERHPVRQNDLTDVLVACLSDMFDSQSTLWGVSRSGAGMRQRGNAADEARNAPCCRYRDLFAARWLCVHKYVHTYACIPLLLLLHPLLASLQSPPLLTHYPLNNGRELQLELCMVNRWPHARQKSVVTYLPFLRLRCGERWHLWVARAAHFIIAN